MGKKEEYEKGKQELLNDKSICKENREWFKEFFEKEEKKLKQMNGLPRLDNGTYQTLCGYISKFRNVNMWFNNKPIKIMPDEVFNFEWQRVYDGLEDGTIKNQKGLPFKDKRSYYNKIFKSKPFEMIGKAHLVKEAMEFHGTNNEGEVRFFEEQTKKEIMSVLIQLEHKVLT